MGRHATHEIQIIQLTDGRAKPFQLLWREPDPKTGKPRRKSQFFATYAEAETLKAAGERRAALTPGTRPRGGQHSEIETVRTFAEQWMEDHVVPRKKASTARSYRNSLDVHILPTIGDCVLSNATLGYREVVKVVSRVAKGGGSWGTQKATIRVLSVLLQEAVRYGHLIVNPAMRVTQGLRPSTAIDPEPNPLSATQMEAFLTWVREHAPDTYEYFLCLFRTGMRIGEAAALEWTAIDLPHGRAKLSKNYSHEEKARHPTRSGDITLKTHRPHEIDLSSELVMAFEALRRRRTVEEFGRGRKTSPYVFLTVTGHRMIPSCRRGPTVWRQGLTAIGAEHHGHTRHDARDTFATSHLLHDPRRLAWVSWMLGHKTIATTLSRYTRFLPDSNAGAGYASTFDSPAVKRP